LPTENAQKLRCRCGRWFAVRKRGREFTAECKGCNQLRKARARVSSSCGEAEGVVSWLGAKSPLAPEARPGSASPSDGARVPQYENVCAQHLEYTRS
jgi:hypothetical protein